MTEKLFTGTLRIKQPTNLMILDYIFQEVHCPRCAELQTVKDELREELLLFKAKAEDLEVKIEEVKIKFLI